MAFLSGKDKACVEMLEVLGLEKMAITDFNFHMNVGEAATITITFLADREKVVGLIPILKRYRLEEIKEEDSTLEEAVKLNNDWLEDIKDDVLSVSGFSFVVDNRALEDVKISVKGEPVIKGSELNGVAEEIQKNSQQGGMKDANPK